MLVIERLVQEFDSCYIEFIDAKENNNFHEATDTLSFMTGLTRAMTIVLDSNVMEYALSDRISVDRCISIINEVYNN